MKKVLMLFSLVICVFFITGCEGKKLDSYIQIDYNELQSKLEGKDTFMLVIGKASCSACAIYRNTLVEVVKDKNVYIYYIDLESISKDEYSKIYSKYVINSTPTSIFFKDGEEVTTYDRLIGAADYGTVISSMKKYGLVGE